ncbi:DNA-3-methyladenine glycosylase [Leifsonia sp. NPDC058292]|uniref:DNA-3-methyladenine glycosylase n=1 Tax=Leifsonia sp. NPDC058292 TaxID=3346428 RepID=UPI0036DD8DEC
MVASNDDDGLFQPDREFFAGSSLDVAPRLLGGVLRHETPDGTVALRLTEVEAYVGNGVDPGSHAFRGRTKRNEVMFGPPAHLYAYFTYGMHVCANVVCSPEGEPSGVLLRAAEVVGGADLALARRSISAASGGSERGPRAVAARDLARGPARLVVAAGIRLDENGSDLFEPPFSLRIPRIQQPYAAGPRTGISGAGGGDDYPWRFWLPGDPSVSPYKRHPKSH